MKVATLFAVVLFASFFPWTSEASAQTTLKLRGEAHTNNLDQRTTLGSAKLKLKGIKLECGILGQLEEESNPDQSLRFHTR